MGRGFAWLDTGTHDSLIEATNYVKAIENRQGLKIACLEMISLQMGFITKQKFQELAAGYGENEYGQYLADCVNELK